ncbi:class 1 fructose-bisphosphatase [Alphaproteobacteria bacterium]|nr:class 1 fructose-bisphosphatase [Alphaproteobacteria bacterium]
MYLSAYLSEYCKDTNLNKVIINLSNAAIQISKIIRNLNNDINNRGESDTKNFDGDVQKPLDILSDEILMQYMSNAPVSGYASEEQEGFVDLKNNHSFIVIADPLDGSSNIDVNVSIGTIFSIMPQNNLPLEQAFLQKGREQKSAGFFVYGPQVTLFLTVGKGTVAFGLDEDKSEFVLINDKIKIPKSTSEFAINASYSRFWDKATSNYIKDCQGGKDGPKGKDFGMRWVGSLVADASRIFNRGGIFLYPADKRLKNKHGRLRLTYEANPLAMLIKEAEGRATNGIMDILDVEVVDIHQRSPLIFGSTEEVENFIHYSSNL